MSPNANEDAFLEHPDVRRAVCVDAGGTFGDVVCVELAPRAPGARPRAAREALDRIRAELTARGPSNAIVTVLFHPGLKTDAAGAVDRAKLAEWARRRLAARARGREPFPVLRVVPIAGWLYIALGLVVHLPHPVLRFLWLLDVALSVGLHALQLAKAIPAGRAAGYTTFASIANTMAYGATWWAGLEPVELRDRAAGVRAALTF